MVAFSDLTKDASEELLGYRGKDFLIVALDSEDINTIVTDRMAFGEFIKNKIRGAGLR